MSLMPDDKLDLVLAKLEKMDQRISQLEASLAEGPGIIGTAMDTVDDYMHRHPHLDPHASLPALEQILLSLAKPELLQSLHALLELTPALLEWAKLLPELKGILATLGDTSDNIADHLAQSGIRLEQSVEQLLPLTHLLLKAETLQTVYRLTQSLETVAHLYPQSVAQAQPIGPVGAIKALNDPDIKHILGIVLAFSKSFHHHLIQQR